MKVRACIYVNPKWCIPYVESLEWSLKQLGVTDKIDIEVASDTPIYSNKSYDLSFFMSGRRSISAKGWDDKCKVFLQLEQLINCRVAGGYHIGRGFDFILEPFSANMHLRGTQNVFYCPIGYAPTWEKPKMKTRKDIDVFFWGGLNPGRINQLELLKENGINVIYGSNFYGDELYDYIARSKISMWLQHQNQIDYAQIHCLPAQAQGEFVMVQGEVTKSLLNKKDFSLVPVKPKIDYGLFDPIVSFVVFGNTDDMLYKVKYYLKHEDERKQFAKNAYNHLKTIPYTNSLTGAVCNFLNHIIEQKKLSKKLGKCWKSGGPLQGETARNSKNDGMNS